MLYLPRRRRCEIYGSQGITADGIRSFDDICRSWIVSDVVQRERTVAVGDRDQTRGFAELKLSGFNSRFLVTIRLTRQQRISAFQRLRDRRRDQRILRSGRNTVRIGIIPVIVGAVASPIISTSGLLVTSSRSSRTSSSVGAVECFPIGSLPDPSSRTAHVTGNVHEIGEEFDPLVIRKRPCLYLC